MTALTRSHSFESLRVKVVGERAFRFHDDRNAHLYQKLIEAYLHYFMPIANSDNAKMESAFALK